MTTTLLAKDTAHKTAWPVFSRAAASTWRRCRRGDFVMVADPSTFRVLPWSEKSGWLLCDIYFTNGKPVPFSTRRICSDALQKLAAAGYDFSPASKSSFICSESRTRA